MEYKIVYSKRKTVSLRVNLDFTVEIRAPSGLSRDIIDELVNKHSSWIEKRIAQIKNSPISPSLTKEEIAQLKNKTRDTVLPIVEKYEKVIGVHPTKISFTSAKKVFGSCTSKKHLNFSFRLALYPYEAIEYVVVHELCHMKEMNHSNKFWYEVEKILPDYKSRRNLLKEKI